MALRSAFTAARGVELVPAAGGSVRLLVADATSPGAPSWSPDGKRIAYGCRRDGQGEICLVAASGGAPIRLNERSVRGPRAGLVA